MMKNICLSSKTIDISENDLFLEITNRLCYYDDSNLNDVMLPYKGYEDSALEYANTLINMPVQAKYKKIDNKDNLGSHEVYLDEDGEIAFGTESIGVHTSVEIKEDNVITVHNQSKTLPCLFATARIWKRNKHMISAIKRLFEEGKLNSSWEIATEEYKYKNGTKILTKYAFLGNTLLADTVTPAYKGTSTTLNVASLNEDALMVAEALSMDLLENNDSNDTSNINVNKEAVMEKTETTISEKLNPIEEQSIVETSDCEDKVNTTENPVDTEISQEETTSSLENNETEMKDNTMNIASLTVRDLFEKITEACRNKLDDWCWIFLAFPEEHTVWVKKDWGDNELTYYVFTYEVNDDVVTVSEPQEGKLTIQVSQLNTTIESLQAEINEKNDALVKASEEISSKDTEISQLKPYKEKVEKAEHDKAIAELEEKKDNLRKLALSSKHIKESELETSEELKKMIDELDEKSIKAVIADRYMSSLLSRKEKTLDTSEVDNKNVTVNLNTDDVDDAVSIVRRNFFKK